MKNWKRIVIIGCILALMVPALGCKEEGSMEKAGKKIDQAADDAQDSVKKLFD